MQAELSGFSTVVVPDFELLVGQNRTLPFSMQVASLSETLTVTGESPLVDISSTQVSGNVDRRQMEELPLQGRNWMELAMQVKGITANAVDTTPGVRDRAFQLNLDGQEITQQVAGSGFGQPKFSREAIAEFQVVTNLFDITQGRSLGIQVQAISRSGTNNYDGSVYGYFRDDKWNAKDFIANRVLPYANQQMGGAIGGPLVKDKAHFFLSFERENEPNTILASLAALPGSSWSFDTKLVQNSFLGRADWQWTPERSHHRTARRTGIGATTSRRSPAPSIRRRPPRAGRKAINMVGTWAKVLSPTKLQEVKIGYTHFDWQNLLAVPALADTPNYVFPDGIIFGQRRNYPQEFFQNTISARYDLTMTADRHDMKFGGEFLRWHDTGQWQLLSRGEYIFTSTPADLARRFPVDAWNDPSQWDVTGLDSIVQRFDQNFGDWTIDIPRPTWAVWFGDTWRMAAIVHGELRRPLGCRLGRARSAAHHDPGHVRPGAGMDVSGPRARTGRHAVSEQPARHRQRGAARRLYVERRRRRRPRDPRRQRVVLQHSRLEHDVQHPVVQRRAHSRELVPERRPARLHPGPDARPHAEDFLSGRFPVPPQGPRVIAHDYQMPSTWQSIVGMQKQIGTPAWLRGRLHALEGLSLRPPARPEPVLQPGDRLQPQSRRRAVPIRSTARFSGSSRTAGPTTRRSRPRSTAATRTTGRRR